VSASSRAAATSGDAAKRPRALRELQVEPTLRASDQLEPPDNFDRVSAINLRGVWACMKHELRQMREQGSGAIVNCSSLGGLVGVPGRASYHASKHGVL
jgi:NAD(P)-dependent dehydrogenase (short-subunit alcohol dehydrogenase family)